MRFNRPSIIALVILTSLSPVAPAAAQPRPAAEAPRVQPRDGTSVTTISSLDADETHIHDEWTKRKFDEGKYKSQEIYGSPRDPTLKKEYEDYLAKKLVELKAQRAQKK